MRRRQPDPIEVQQMRAEAKDVAEKRKLEQYVFFSENCLSSVIK